MLNGEKWAPMWQKYSISGTADFLQGGRDGVKLFWYKYLQRCIASCLFEPGGRIKQQEVSLPTAPSPFQTTCNEKALSVFSQGHYKCFCGSLLLVCCLLSLAQRSKQTQFCLPVPLLFVLAVPRETLFSLYSSLAMCLCFGWHSYCC